MQLVPGGLRQVGWRHNEFRRLGVGWGWGGFCERCFVVDFLLLKPKNDDFCTPCFCVSSEITSLVGKQVIFCFGAPKTKKLKSRNNE